MGLPKRGLIPPNRKFSRVTTTNKHAETALLWMDDEIGTFSDGRFVCISMSSGNRHGYYRFSGAGGIVFYVEVFPTSLLTDDEYCFPETVLKLLPPRPSESCNYACITQNNHVTWHTKSLRGIRNTWHPCKIDLRDLAPVKYFNPNVCEVTYRGQRAISKIALFEYEVGYLERETGIYELLEGRDIAPRFLGHLMEQGRVIGFLLEHIPSRAGTPADYAVCLDVLRRLHALRIVHNDIYKQNFLIVDEGEGTEKRALLCDFSESEGEAQEEVLREEEGRLEGSLASEFGDDDADWSEFGQFRLREMSEREYRI